MEKVYLKQASFLTDLVFTGIVQANSGIVEDGAVRERTSQMQRLQEYAKTKAHLMPRTPA